MNFINYSRLRLIFFIIVLFFLWQILKFLPWLEFASKTDKDNPTNVSIDLAPVVVSVFYEALCPDSKNFIVKHLLPTVIKAPRLINVSLIPYGKAKTEEDVNGGFLFSCQHGQLECNANKIHACAILKIPNALVQVRYISCMISDNMIPEWIGEKCAKELGLDWQPILECSKSDMGSLLLKKHGMKTDSLRPKISFVPTVLLNGEHRDQTSILKNLFSEICRVINGTPSECSSLL